MISSAVHRSTGEQTTGGERATRYISVTFLSRSSDGIVTACGDSKELLEFVRRLPAFEAFDGSSLGKHELAESVSVSRPTAHRIIESFEQADLIERRNGTYELTPYGEAVGDIVRTYRDEIVSVNSLKSLINSLPDDVGFDYRLFSDAVVTEASYDNPFRPMNRFIELFEEATRIQGFNKSFLEPMYIDVAYEQIEAGMESDIIYEPNVIDLVVSEYPNIAQKAFENGHVTAAVHDDLPLAMAIFDGRIGLGVHAESMGTPIAWVDTDNPEAIAWGEALFERYKTESTPLVYP